MRLRKLKLFVAQPVGGGLSQHAAHALRTSLRQSGVALVALPTRSLRELRKVLAAIHPLRAAAARTQGAGADDGTSFGLQCLMSPLILPQQQQQEQQLVGSVVGENLNSPSPPWAFQLQCFGPLASNSALAGLPRALLGIIAEPEEDGAPGKLPECSPALHTGLQSLALEMHKLARALLLRGVCRPPAQQQQQHQLQQQQRQQGNRNSKPAVKLGGAWAHELLINFYSGAWSAAGPRLYSHTDLAALTLLLVPAHGGGKLVVREDCSVDFQAAAFSARRRSRFLCKQRGPHARSLASPLSNNNNNKNNNNNNNNNKSAPLARGLAAVLVGKRLSEVSEAAAATLPPTEHRVVAGPSRGPPPGSRQGHRLPRLSIAFFYCRHMLEETCPEGPVIVTNSHDPTHDAMK
ncbi:unnamed protein product [Polarella glacialis]|uniref:Uncharacterized protein n=1 Tax=Polarella glacialis TaxID=89957 RepID=A0A813LZG0_POLGL|nr:unnamed protein product [Polarella glacialis]